MLTCNWIACPQCYSTVTHGIKAPFQTYGLQVRAILRSLHRTTAEYHIYKLLELHVQEGYTALIAASSAGQLECVRLLIQHGADVNTADPVGQRLPAVI